MSTQDQADSLLTLKDIDNDVSEWFCHYILHQPIDVDTDAMFESLEILFPRTTPMKKSSPVTIRYEALVLWQEALYLSKAGLKEGNFTLVMDKLMNFKNKHFKTSEPEAFTRIWTMLEIQKGLQKLWLSLDELDKSRTTKRGIDQKVTSLYKAFTKSIEIASDMLETPFPPLRSLTGLTGKLRIRVLRVWTEQQVGLELGLDPYERNVPPFAFKNMQKSLQKLLLQWLYTSLGQPTLVKLGYGGLGQKEEEEEEETSEKPPSARKKATKAAKKAAKSQNTSLVEELSPAPKETTDGDDKMLSSPARSTRSKRKATKSPKSKAGTSTPAVSIPKSKFEGSQSTKSMTKSLDKGAVVPPEEEEESEKENVEAKKVEETKSEQKPKQKSPMIEKSIGVPQKRKSPTIWLDSSDDEEYTESYLSRRRKLRKFERAVASMAKPVVAVPASKAKVEASVEEPVKEFPETTSTTKEIPQKPSAEKEMKDATQQTVLQPLPQNPDPRKVEELKAVIQGIHRYGFGNWTIIQKRSGGILRKKTVAQVKNMAIMAEKNGLL